jgi:aminoglycoside phosphotransferase (APT) family kinase protein
MSRAAAERVPATVDDITPQWLTSVFRSGNRVPYGVTVTDVRAEQFAQDIGFSSQLYRLHLSGSDGIPSTIVAKLPAKPGIREAVSLLGGYQRELLFYQRFAPVVPMATPLAYAAQMAPESSDFVLLLEDLHGWENGDHLAGLSIDRVRLCLRELAALHAWSLTAPNADVPGLFPSIDGPVARDMFVPMFEAGWRVYRDRSETKVPTAVAKYAERFASHAPSALTIMAESPVLLHGDIRADNMFFDEDRLKVVDFQFLSRGAGAVDVAYLVSQSLPASLRRGRDETLVREYLEHLADNGITEVTFDDVWRQYRAATAYYIVIPTILLTSWDTMPPRSRELCLTLVNRAVAAIDETVAHEVVE